MSAHGELVLAVDTSGAPAGLVLAGSDRIDVALLPRREGGQARTEELAAVAGGLLASRGCEASDLTALGAVVGPGSYTGLRSGLAFLRGLAFADALPAVAVGSLELLAWRGAGMSESVSVALPLGAGRVVAAAYARSAEDLRLLAEARVVEEADLPAFFDGPSSGCTALVLGGEDPPDAVAAAALHAGLEVRPAPGEALRELASLVLAKARRAETAHVEALLPVYVGWSSPRPNRDRVALPGASE